MRSIDDRGGARLPLLGQGTWRMGERTHARQDEVAALRLGLDLGMSLIDTAEMYGEGGAEEVVGLALAGRREEAFVVTKVLPTNASYEGTLHAAERSLRRLRTERIDLYLLHWPGAFPLEETYRAFAKLREQGKVLHYGVSNFDLAEMRRSDAVPGGERVGVNQVLYNLARRGIERRLLPWCREHRVTVMAYTPLQPERLGGARSLREIAASRGCSPWQVALAWTIRAPGVMAIPKSSDPRHVRENAAAAEIALTEDELALLDGEFPRPRRDGPLETL